MLYSQGQPIEVGKSFSPSESAVYYSDYETLQSNFFYAMIINEDTNIIEKGFGCGIHENGNAFCMETSSDGSTDQENRALLNGPTLWNGSCDNSRREYIKCTKETDSAVYNYKSYSSGKVYMDKIPKCTPKYPVVSCGDYEKYIENNKFGSIENWPLIAM